MSKLYLSVERKTKRSSQIITRPKPFVDLALGTIRFRPVVEADSSYLYSLRHDPTLNRHLSAPPPSLEGQSRWIRAYLEREAAGDEYYFVIERQDGTPCGAVRLYDFQPDSFCWGSWILDQNKTRFAAIESALLVYRIGFDTLRFSASHFDVRKANVSVISFHKKFGAEVTAEDADNVYMRLSQERFNKAKPRVLSLIRSRIADT